MEAAKPASVGLGSSSVERASRLPNNMPANFTPTISIIAPTYNERMNVRRLVQAIAQAMADISWELVIVDDDSLDGTAEEAWNMAHEGYPVRCIRRIGRRGLASAVVEGVLASNAPFIAVMDADMQHDEAMLPKMLDILRTTDTDLVIGSRYIEGGSLGAWSDQRKKMSAFAKRCARSLIGSDITDPMSGFFALRRDVFYARIYDLSQQGYKILLDILTSSRRPLQIVEVPYVFRPRSLGESKVDVMVIAEFAFLLIEKLTRGLVPPRFVLFSMVGCLGLMLHLSVLEMMGAAKFSFLDAQTVATVAAMTLNYVINNSVTYRSQRLKGFRFFGGYVVFCAVCGIGGLANIGVANLVLHGSGNWPAAGIAGAVMSAVFNFGTVTQFVWRQRRSRRTSAAGA